VLNNIMMLVTKRMYKTEIISFVCILMQYPFHIRTLMQYFDDEIYFNKYRIRKRNIEINITILIKRKKIRFRNNSLLHILN